MDLDSFVVENFKITDTRAFDPDTLTLNHAVIGDGLVAHRALVSFKSRQPALSGRLK